MPTSIRVQRISSTKSRISEPGFIAKTLDLMWVSTISPEISLPEDVRRRHTHLVSKNQCCSAVVQAIEAPVEIVWSFVRQFDNPQAYKHFLKSCRVVHGNGEVGSVREVTVISGLPAGKSIEKLEILDDEKHVTSFRVVGGDHRLRNYRSITTVHADGAGATVLVESYEVDVPEGNTVEETCAFANTIVKCNLQSLAQISYRFSEKLNFQIIIFSFSWFFRFFLSLFVHKC